MAQNALRIIHTAKGNEHDVAFRADLTTKHYKLKEEEIVCILGIVVPAHKIPKQIDLTEYVQRSKAVF